MTSRKTSGAEGAQPFGGAGSESEVSRLRQENDFLQSRRRELESRLSGLGEELAAAKRDLDSFTYSATHDLRNPLQAINALADCLIQDCSGRLDDICLEYVTRIKDSAIRMNSIIDGILALSRTSRQDIEIREIDLSEAARWIINDLRQRERGRVVESVVAEGVRARGDVRLVSVVLEQLIGNAWKFSAKAGRPRIEFGSRRNDGKEIYYVKDNGAGFDRAKADRLFKPFSKLHSAREFPGNGIGLAIVKRAVERHGGRVWAEGEAGKGATFYFSLG